MHDLVDYLMAFQPTLKSAQYSINGNWEDAVEISLDNPKATPIVNGINDSVAVELFYTLRDDRKVFLGVRFSRELAPASTPSQFLDVVLGSIKDLRVARFDTAVSLLGNTLNDDPAAYTDQQVHHVELGIEGFWKSEGALVLRAADEDKLDGTTLNKLLQNHPHLIRNNKNYTALEFAVLRPEAWIGIQVSERVDDAFVTNTDALVRLSNMI